MSTASSARLLRLALPLVRTHGFTREALARSVLSEALPAESRHTEPLNDTAVSALFGNGDDARRTLINAWLKGGLREMGRVKGIARPSLLLHDELPVKDASALMEEPEATRKATVRDVLKARLEYNESALAHLPEAFAVLATPSAGIHFIDPVPALNHAASIAKEACYLTGDQSLELEWYARRTSLAAIYAAAELHQLTSPTSSYAFLDSLLESSSNLKASLDEVGLYGSYLFKSWKGIIKSSGIL